MMFARTTIRITISVLMATMIAAPQFVHAQIPNRTARSTANQSTRLTIELLMSDPSAAVLAQRWGQTFQQLGHSARIRQPRADDRTGITEKTERGTRHVLAIGAIDARGRAVFGREAFTTSDTRRLSDWLKQLQEYGAQGSPAGKPLWGLDEKQFSTVFQALGAKPNGPLAEGTVQAVIDGLKLPPQFPLQTPATVATQWNQRIDLSSTTRQHLETFSKGTVLAIVLRESGLGFAPSRQPDGSIHLTIHRVDEAMELWPVGWEPRVPATKAAPALYQLIPVDLPEVDLMSLLAAIAQHTKIPILIDHHALRGHNIDPTKLDVSIKPRNLTWHRILYKATGAHRLRYQLMTDELGEPFIWVTMIPSSKERSQRPR